MKTAPTILVVDDEDVILEAARRILSANGYEVQVEGDAEAALKRIDAEPPNVIVVDLKLPGLSGLDLLDRTRGRLTNTAVIVMTGYANPEQAVASLRAGAFDFLPKPFTYDEFLSPVHRALRFLEWPEPERHPKHSDADPDVVFLGLHAWARYEAEGRAVLGVTDIFVRSAGRLRSASLPNLEAPVRQGGVLARFGTADEVVHTAWAAESGTVLEVNLDAAASPANIEQDPLGEGWIVRVRTLGSEVEVGGAL